MPVFEGPFDLLVYLIETAEMDIYDIQISVITEQYMEYVRNLDRMNIRIHSEFMVLAATLLRIKSEMMLPGAEKIDGSEKEEDPRNELVERIIEYRRFKACAELFADRWQQNMDIYEKPGEDISQYIENPDEYLSLELEGFIKAFERFMHKKVKEDEMKRQYVRVRRDRISVESRILFIKEKLVQAERTGLAGMDFKELVPNTTSRYDAVLSFVSVLQMTRDGLLDVKQKSVCGNIVIVPAGA